ncbi:DUF3718 domain-containing protein [Flocculibacter collagenilyticus]|uniref:DUF3718 domain-containing protein n=1 Tax=Flocculibacter collagenilyticus TaxID=2744479 RepID=UPI0018F45677|nr:DUF3718 domain-containing protein [Flocculibacter collagenilyticus]
MKNLLLPLILLSPFAVVPTTASASDLAVSVCEYVSADDKKRLRKFLKSNNLKIRNIFDGVKCNGSDLLSFASAQNAVNTGTLIIKKLPKNTVASLMGNIANADLLSAAQKRAG